MSFQLHAGGVRAEADQLRVVAGSGGKALRADVQRLEQVRLARAVRAGDQDEARLQALFEPRVRAKVDERDRLDDQLSRAEAPLAVPTSGRAGFARASV
jgi:hypothetical protein